MTIPEMVAVLQAAERGEELQSRRNDAVADSEWYNWSGCYMNFVQYDYRIKPKPRLVPLGPEDVSPGNVLKETSSPNRWLVLSVFTSGLKTIESTYGWEYLFNDKCYEVSRDGGRTWSRCEKEAK